MAIMYDLVLGTFFKLSMYYKSYLLNLFMPNVDKLGLNTEELIGLVGLLITIGGLIFRGAIYLYKLWKRSKEDEDLPPIPSGGTIINNYPLIDKPYIVAFFGLPGSGKTTIIRRLNNTVDTVEQIDSTKDIEIQQGIFTSAEFKRKIKAQFIDYKGQKPSQLFQFNPPNSVNALFIILDLAPRMYFQGTKAIVPYDKFLKWFKGNPEKIMSNRILQHEKYVSQWTIEPLITKIFSKELECVKILINKRDLIEELIKDCDYEISDNIETHILDMFDGIIREVKHAFYQNGMKNVSVEIISAREYVSNNILNSLLIDQISKLVK